MERTLAGARHDGGLIIGAARAVKGALRDLLEARMKIHSYNQHTRLLFFRVLVSQRCQVYSAWEEPTLLSNQIHSSTVRHAAITRVKTPPATPLPLQRRVSPKKHTPTI
jgi:hypothetical protein